MSENPIETENSWSWFRKWLIFSELLKLCKKIGNTNARQYYFLLNYIEERRNKDIKSDANSLFGKGNDLYFITMRNDDVTQNRFVTNTIPQIAHNRKPKKLFM